MQGLYPSWSMPCGRDSFDTDHLFHTPQPAVDRVLLQGGHVLEFMFRIRNTLGLKHRHCNHHAAVALSNGETKRPLTRADYLGIDLPRFPLALSQPILGVTSGLCFYSPFYFHSFPTGWAVDIPFQRSLSRRHYLSLLIILYFDHRGPLSDPSDRLQIP